MQKEHNQCGAKTRSGAPCKNAPMSNGRCRMHGGKSRIGPASGTYRTGRYSKFLPARMAAKYQEAVADDELLALREDIALVDARLSDVLRRVDSGESGQLWSRLQGQYAEMLKARRAGDALAQAEALNEIGSLIRAGAADYQAWDEIGRLLEQRRRLVESERKRLVEMQQVLSLEQALVLMGVVLDIIRRNVSDRSILAAISADITRLVAHSTGAGADAQPGRDGASLELADVAAQAVP
jgi:hypothetical protein